MDILVPGHFHLRSLKPVAVRSLEVCTTGNFPSSDISNAVHFGPGTFCPQETSVPGHFYLWTFRSGQFSPRTFRSRIIMVSRRIHPRKYRSQVIGILQSNAILAYFDLGISVPGIFSPGTFSPDLRTLSFCYVIFRCWVKYISFTKHFSNRNGQRP